MADEGDLRQSPGVLAGWFFCDGLAVHHLYCTHCLHDPRYIYTLGAPHRTGKTGGTEPYRAAGHKGRLIIQLRFPDDPVGQKVHGFSHGTAGGTFAALVAGKEFLPAERLYPLRKK